MWFGRKPANRKIVAHLGAHKTATSLVQKYFKDKQKYYKRKGVHFITRRDISPYISWGQVVVRDPSSLASGIAEQTKRSNAGVILFSNENALGQPLQKRPGLYPSAKEIIPAIAKSLQNYDVRIAYTIRPQWEFLESYYLQRVHQGYFLSFNQFLEGVDLESLYWEPLIESLRAEFGQENVNVQDFGLIRQGQSAYLSEFIQRNISPEIVPDLDYDTVHNASLSDRGLQIALRINPLLKDGETSVVRKFLQKHFSNLTEPRPKLMAEAMKETLKERYKSDYESLIS